MVEKGWQEAYEDNRYDDEDEAKEEVREQESAAFARQA